MVLYKKQRNHSMRHTVRHKIMGHKIGCRLSIVITILALGACGGSSDSFNGDTSLYDSDSPKIEKQKVGRPYQISGRWYTPAIDNDYSEVGIASWYGPGFDGRPTANGEKFDEDKVSAAHTTLPLPSYVEVTNLDNGKQLYVRVNDRGPFADDRIIDLSKRAAELLGSRSTGLARVRVKIAEPPKNVTLVAPDGTKIIGKGYTPSKPETMMVADNTDNKPLSSKPISQSSQSQPTQVALNDLPLYEDNTITNATVLDNVNNKPLDNASNDMASSQHYAIKIGVFSEPDNILSLKQNLTSLGDLQIDPIYRQGKMLSEVSLKGYKTKQAALNTLDALAQLGINDAIIINKNL